MALNLQTTGTGVDPDADVAFARLHGPSSTAIAAEMHHAVAVAADQADQLSDIAAVRTGSDCEHSGEEKHNDDEHEVVQHLQD